MPSSKANAQWTTRWKYEMTAKALRPGIWGLKNGGFFMRTRVLDPRSGKFVEHQRVLRNMTLNEAVRAKHLLRSDAQDVVSGRKQAPMLWSSYAASLFEAKVNEGKIKSAKGREKWATTLRRLIPALGHLYVDEMRTAHVMTWRNEIARWLRDGMPSIRKRDAGKRIKLSPATANGWISVVKVICGTMTKHFELERDPSAALEYFPVPRTYTREQPNALTPSQASAFLGEMRELHPQHYAMTYLGFAIGARPSTLRPLRRSGPSPDLLTDEGVLLLRRSHSLGKEIMDETKTGRDQELPLPSLVLWVLREHVASLEGAMATSEYLFPSVKGGLRARSVLDKPFADVAKALGFTVKVTPKAMRRTFQDLARRAQVHDLVTRAISGHATERMQRHYSTAQREEMLSAVDRVVSLFSPETDHKRVDNDSND